MLRDFLLRRLSIPAGIALVSAGVFAAQPAHGYPVDQAAAGKAVYEQNCLRCHGADGISQGGAPSLAGPNSRLAERRPNAQALYDYLSVRMPRNAPGTLTVNDAWAVTAYILSLNGIEPDDMTLDPTTAAGIELSAGGSPIELPAGE